MKPAIKRIQVILDDIAKQAIEIDTINNHSTAHKIIQENDIFSETLFLTHSDQFKPYIDEIRHKTNELSRLILANKNTLAHSRLQLIEQQISALRTALNSNKTIHKEAEQRLVAIKARKYKKAAQAVMQSSHDLHKKLNETMEFERRLLAMIEDKERQRQQSNSKLSKCFTDEIIILHQRLGRCRQAISKLEREIVQSQKII